MTKRLLAFAATACALALAQTEPGSVQPMLDAALLTPDVVSYQIRNYLIQKAPALPQPASAAGWTATAKQIREKFLREVVFHGWPAEWVNAPLKVEDLGLIPSGPGYRMRKLRYEIVPGFYSVAILYEPEKMTGKVPAILNVNGHVGAPGKSVEYKQKRCIHLARHGILNLNLEWIGFGELTHQENQHWFGAHLDLAGANNLGLFYLAMRKGLDYLYQHPNTDRARIGVTGLSGGGWQTIVLSSLDERVTLAVPVAGYSAITYRLERIHEVGDVEQNAPDMQLYADYSHLTAMRAPRPTLLVYNAEDGCCFRAPLVKPDVYDAVQPFFKLYGKPENFAWHMNTDPSDHNYQLDNRLAAYRFIGKQFGIAGMDVEEQLGPEIKSYDDLIVGIPKDNLTVLGLARKLALRVSRPAIPPAGAAREAWSVKERARLARVLRYKPVALARPWKLANTLNKGLETRSYRLDFSNGLSATAVWFQALETSSLAPATIVLDEKGKKAAASVVSDRVNRGEQVLAVDPIFYGDAAPSKPRPAVFTQVVSALGDRPLALEAGQLIETARWFAKQSGAKSVRLEANGFRAQVSATAAAALAPGLFSEIVIHNGKSSLAYIYDTPVEYGAAPDLFCLDLYKEFDLDRLAALAAPARIAMR
jgi:dienelactone hydrolase